MNKHKAEDIVTQLLLNAEELKYGTVTVSAKLHDSRIVEMTYIKTEQTREKEPKQENNQ
jgi:hypothetical protein